MVYKSVGIGLGTDRAAMKPLRYRVAALGCHAGLPRCARNTLPRWIATLHSQQARNTLPALA
jgi:hypothetical protein